MTDLDAQMRAAIMAADPHEIERIAALMEREQSKRPPQLLPSALWYAAKGLHVFALTPQSKVPLPGTHGCKDATTDPATIRRWWAATPDANVGIATGHLVDVIDVDGTIGVKTWLSMEDMPPILGQVSTPRPGGHHLYITADPTRRNKTAMFPGMDYRGAGGYVVAPPSTTPQGTYLWYRPIKVPVAP